MKNIQKKSNIKLAQPTLEAPIALTPDQIAMVAAGSDTKGSETTRGGARPVEQFVIR